MSDDEVFTSIKGFDLNWKCGDFQFEIGKTYEHIGSVKACESGFHAIGGYPLEVFDYYAPGVSRYAEVTQFGDFARHEGGSKIASAKITIGVELSISQIVTRTIAWVASQCAPANTKHSERDRSAASSTGYRSAASSTGHRSAAFSTGHRSVAFSTGHRSVASSTGYRSAASSTGDRSAAMSVGRCGRVMGENGCAIFLVYRDDDWKIIHAWAGIVGRDGIKPLTWYQLDENGQPQEYGE